MWHVQQNDAHFTYYTNCTNYTLYTLHTLNNYTCCLKICAYCTRNVYILHFTHTAPNCPWNDKNCTRFMHIAETFTAQLMLVLLWIKRLQNELRFMVTN